MEDAARQWQPIETAPKNGTPVLLRFKDSLRAFDTSDEFRLERWQGLAFVGRHSGHTRNDYDMGWAFAAPVGHGGFPDAWLVGWMAIPNGPTPEDAASGTGRGET